jgi:formamidopyrimidine-DNA glycosylase
MLRGATVTGVLVRDRRLRWPVPDELAKRMVGQRVDAVRRRAKYLLWDTARGTCMVHLGMSGSLRVVPTGTPYHTHDHVVWQLEGGSEVRLRDPRRFGSVHWIEGDLDAHPLLSSLGPEPLGNEFNAQWLHDRSRGKRVAVKAFVMDAKQVVGVGNIYASESLYRSGIHPTRAAGRIALPRYESLVQAIRTVLADAIIAGGTTLRDFAHNDGEPGYFAQELKVYGREGEPCNQCSTPIKRKVIGQRSSFFCARCQR